MYLFQFISSFNIKQLSTFHLPFGGDENVLAKNLMLWRQCLDGKFSMLWKKLFLITWFFKTIINMKYITCSYYYHHTSLTSTRPLLASTPHRPWACRGMPFDDVCQMPSATQSFPARCGGETPSFILEDSGRVLNPSSVPPALSRNLGIFLRSRDLTIGF